MEIIRWIQSFSNPFFDLLFQLITMMGEEVAFIFLGAALYWCVDKRIGYRLAFACLTSAILNTALKEVFRVPRPVGREGIRSLRLETATGYSFPSGHSQQAASLWTSLMLYYRKKALVIPGILAMLLVGLSRLYLGVHTPADVIGGLIIGAGWTFVASSLFDYIERTGKYKLLLLLGAAFVPAMAVIQNSIYYKTAGAGLAFVLGYIIEVKYIQFEVKASLWQQIVKFCTGMLGLYIIKEFGKMILPQAIWSDFARYFLLGVWLTVIVPFIFKHFMKEKVTSEETEGLNH